MGAFLDSINNVSNANYIINNNKLVEPSGIEPLTSTLPVLRSPS